MKKQTEKTLSTREENRLAKLKSDHVACEEKCRQLLLSPASTDAEISEAKRQRLRAKDAMTAFENTLNGVPLAPRRHTPQLKVVKTKKGARTPVHAAAQAFAATG